MAGQSQTQWKNHVKKCIITACYCIEENKEKELKKVMREEKLDFA
ncbi:MAG: hypothetical protein ACOZFS_06815 [Thermodesulfobacteriota bacterium]